MTVSIRVKLSTIVKADKNLEREKKLTYRISRAVRRSGDRTVKPIIVIDTVPNKDEQRVAGTFLDYFAVPHSLVIEPEFEFVKGIRREELKEFFRSYEKTLSYYVEMKLRTEI